MDVHRKSCLKKYFILIFLVILSGCSINESNNNNIENLTNNDVVRKEMVTYSEYDKERISLINKWKYELDKRLYTILVKAAIDDPFLIEIIDKENFKSDLSEETVKHIKDWAYNGITHTQGLEVFKEEPGKDPWGIYGPAPTYKKLLPSEMNAMSMYSDKITGKCTSIAHFLYGLLRKLGLEIDNSIIFYTKSHTMSIFKVDEKFYMTSNNTITELSDSIIDKMSKKTFYGFYNDKYSFKGNLKINEQVLTNEISIVDGLIAVNSINSEEIYIYKENDYIDYAKQLLSVNSPNLYVQASIKGPLVNELSEELNDVNIILSWIFDNVEQGHVLGFEESIQTADQTIVFLKGNNRDKALLALSLLKINNIDARVSITKNDSYLIINEDIYSMKHDSIVKNIKDSIIIELG